MQDQLIFSTYNIQYVALHLILWILMLSCTHVYTCTVCSVDSIKYIYFAWCEEMTIFEGLKENLHSDIFFISCLHFIYSLICFYVLCFLWHPNTYSNFYNFLIKYFNMEDNLYLFIGWKHWWWKIMIHIWCISIMPSTS